MATNNPRPWLLTIENAVQNHSTSHAAQSRQHQSPRVPTSLQETGFPYIRAKQSYDIQRQLQRDLLGSGTYIRALLEDRPKIWIL